MAEHAAAGVHPCERTARVFGPIALRMGFAYFIGEIGRKIEERNFSPGPLAPPCASRIDSDAT